MHSTSRTASRRSRRVPDGSGYTCGMDAAPVLAEIGRHLQSVKLEAVLIGNAAAALQGAPVTTVDFDFLYRKTSHNVSKSHGRSTPRYCGRTIPCRTCFGWFVTTMACRSTSWGRFTGYDRSRACVIVPPSSRSKGQRFWSPPCLISSGARKRPAGRAISQFSTSWSIHVRRPNDRAARLRAVAAENRRAVREMIRRWQLRPPAHRTHFLRRRVGFRASAL